MKNQDVNLVHKQSQLRKSLSDVVKFQSIEDRARFLALVTDVGNMFTRSGLGIPGTKSMDMLEVIDVPTRTA